MYNSGLSTKNKKLTTTFTIFECANNTLFDGSTYIASPSILK